MTAQIRPNRLEVSDRFPMLGFSIRTDRPDVEAEVALATQIDLFAPENRTRRTAANFYSSRENGRLSVPRGEGVFVVPADVLARFIGGDKLYFGLATGKAGDGGLNVDAMPREGSPYVALTGLTGRTLRRAHFGGRAVRPGSGPVLDWSGDKGRPGSEPTAPSNGQPAGGRGANGASNGAATNGAASMPATNGGGMTTMAAAAAYDDGFGPMTSRRAPNPRAPQARPFAHVDLIYRPSDPAQAAAALADFARRESDWRAGVGDTRFFPHAAICHLVMTAPDGTQYYGTGFYVANDLILTVGHNLAGMATARVLIGRNGASQYLGDFTAHASDWTVHPSYVANVTDYDLAVIRTTTAPPTGLTFTLEELRVSQASPIIVCGYGAETVDPFKQHLDGDQIREIASNGNVIRYNLQTEKGNSGSPVFYVDAYEDDERRQSVQEWKLVGVHSASHDSSVNQACALTDAKIAWVRGRGLAAPQARSAAQGMSGAQALANAPLVARGAASAARPAAGAAMRGGPSRALDADPLTVDVKYRMFIPSPLIDAPIGAYGGDGRGFSYEGGESRGEIHAKVKLTANGKIETITVVDRHWGESTGYAADQAWHPEGKPDWWLEKVEGAAPTERARLQANDANLSIQLGAAGTVRPLMSVNEPSSLLSITASGGLPLSVVSPSIDADIGVFLRINGSNIEAKIEGEHDGFPAHELYLNGRLIYGYDPVAQSESPIALLPPMDRVARTGWTAVATLGSAAMGVDDAAVMPALADRRARASRIGGQFADRIGRALDLGLPVKSLDPLLDLLDPPAVQPADARAMDGGIGAAVAIAGIVISTLTSSQGDITWDLDQGRGIKHPNDQAPANPGPFRDGEVVTISGPQIENLIADMITANFEVRWQYNGRSLGNVVIGNLSTNDAVGWGLAVRAQLMDDNIVYPPASCAALRIRFHWRFSRVIGSDSIAVSDLTLYGDGRTAFSTRWTQS